jgi:hypothetical protein
MMRRQAALRNASRRVDCGVVPHIQLDSLLQFKQPNNAAFITETESGEHEMLLYRFRLIIVAER